MVLTSVSIDEDVLKKARNSQINISAAAQSGIKTRMGIKEVEIDISENQQKCVDCHKIGVKETAETVKLNNPDGLTWLWPDEHWICNACLSARGRKIAQ